MVFVVASVGFARLSIRTVGVPRRAHRPRPNGRHVPRLARGSPKNRIPGISLPPD
jgi:hypothetical protein